MCNAKRNVLLLVYYHFRVTSGSNPSISGYQKDSRGIATTYLASYTATFKLFLAFVIYCGLPSPSHMDTIVLYLEYLAQNNLKACSLRNHIAVLKHFFALFDWPVQALSSRKVQLMVKSVQMNAQLQIKVKGVFTVKLLRKLIQQTDKYHNGCVFKALFLVAFYGFFRLASLLPPAAAMFDRTRFPVVGDLIWGNWCPFNCYLCKKYAYVRPISSSSVANNTGWGLMSSDSIENYDKIPGQAFQRSTLVSD